MLTLPKPYLSYSAVDLWYSSKSAYRQRYYLNIKGQSNVQMDYGKEIADLLKDNPEHPDVAHIPKLPIRDVGFTVDISGVPVLMYPDSLALEPAPHFYEYKTGEWIPDKPAWTQEKVDNHMQLKVYSLGIKEHHGAVMDECKLLWLVSGMVTEMDTVRIGGKETIVPFTSPKLTGQIISFTTVVTEMERYRAREWIVQAAHEISRDFSNYQKNL